MQLGPMHQRNEQEYTAIAAMESLQSILSVAVMSPYSQRRTCLLAVSLMGLHVLPKS